MGVGAATARETGLIDGSVRKKKKKKKKKK